MSVDCHWSHWSYLQCYCQCRPTSFFLIDQEFCTVNCLQWWFHLRKYSMQPSGTRLLEKKKSARELEILLCADQGHKSLWTLRRLLLHCYLRLQEHQAFLNGKSPESMEYCFLAFPGNPAIKECQIRVRRSSVENCLLAFRAFPGIPGKPGEHGHSWIFPKIDPGEFRTPCRRVNPNKKPKCHNSRNFDG